jgi:hypothetical protein
MDALTVAGIVVAASAAFAGLGYYVADQKGRSPAEGLLLGLLFGPLGCLIEALLPAQERDARPSPARSKRRSRYDFQEEVDDAEEARAADYLGLLPKPDPQPTGLDDIRFDTDLRK